MHVLAALAILWLAAPLAAEPERHGDLIVHVHGLRSANGTIRVKVHHHGDDFPATNDVIARELQPARGGSASFAFPALPHGTYAVVVLHDEDNDSNLDRGLLGRPLEGLGFSNDARVLFGPPSFGEAAFELRVSRLELRIEVSY